MHSSIVLGMTIVADCKVYESVTVHAKVYISYIYMHDVNDIHIHHCICTSVTYWS